VEARGRTAPDCIRPSAAAAAAAAPRQRRAALPTATPDPSPQACSSHQRMPTTPRTRNAPRPPTRPAASRHLGCRRPAPTQVRALLQVGPILPLRRLHQHVLHHRQRALRLHALLQVRRRHEGARAVLLNHHHLLVGAHVVPAGGAFRGEG
jgi:hypothetical protein